MSTLQTATAINGLLQIHHSMKKYKLQHSALYQAMLLLSGIINVKVIV